jgi:hypothetical protein
MPTLGERRNHGTRIRDILGFPENFAVSFADRVGSENPRGGCTPCSASRGDPTRLEVGECRSNVSSVDRTERERPVIEICWLNLNFEPRVPQHGNTPRGAARENKAHFVIRPDSPIVPLCM